MENESIMTSEQIQPNINLDKLIVTQAGLGKRLRATRESLRLSEKDAAARLHLNAKLIPIMENEDFDNGLPPTFMRGYLRSYARMLNIPEAEINATVAQLEANLPQAPVAVAAPILKTQASHQNYRYLRLMTYVVVAMLAALVSIWWASHPKDFMTPVKKPVNSNPIPASSVTPVPVPASSTPTATPETNTAAPSAPVVTNPTATTDQAPTAPAASQEVSPATALDSNAITTQTAPATSPEMPATNASTDTATAPSALSQAPVMQQTTPAGTETATPAGTTSSPNNEETTNNENDNNNVYSDY